MRNKVLKIAFVFMLFTALFITASYAVEIKEDVSDYSSGAFILGSTRFDINQVITATVAANAGVNEAKLNWFLGKNFDDVDMTFYYYNPNAEIWFVVGEGEPDPLNEPEDKAIVEELENNLNIFFVNNEEKRMEVKYSGTVDTTTISDENVTFNDGIFSVPITSYGFTFFSEDGVENEVVTNSYDKIIESMETGAKIEADDVEIVPEWAVISVGKEYFPEDKLVEAIAKSTPENEAKLLQSLIVDSGLVFDTQKDMNAVLNLNEYYLETYDANYVIELKAPNSKLTIKNGSIYGNKYGAIKADCKHLTNSSVTLNIEEGVYVEGYDYGVVIFGNKATANIKGTVTAINEDGYAISGNGNKGWGGTEVNISGNANVHAEKGIGIYIPQEGVTNISGNAYIEGKTAIAMKAGELNVLGGQIFGSGELVKIPSETNDGTKATGDAIYVESNKGYAGNVKINISENAYLGTVNGGAPVRVYKSNSNDDITITGKYSTAYVDENDNKNIVYEEGEAPIKVGKTNYSWSSLEYALNLFATGAEQEAKLLTDIELNKVLTFDPQGEVKTSTLDLNGCKITGLDNYVIALAGANSKLVIKNSSTAEGIVRGEISGAIKVGYKGFKDSTVTLDIQNGVTVSGFDYGVVVSGNKAIANIAGKVVATNPAGYAVSGNGLAGWEGTEVNILDGAELNATVAIYMPQAGITNIKGGTITGETAVAMKAGTLNITGGTLIANGQKVELPKETNDGVETTGDVIYAESNKGYAGDMVINVGENATLSSTNSELLRVYKSTSTEDATVSGLSVDEATVNSSVVVYTK